MMPKPGTPASTPFQAATSAETAQYVRDLLESLRKIATAKDLGLLAHLIDLASLEAKSHLDRFSATTPDCRTDE
jgi:hypothetical protein